MNISLNADEILGIAEKMEQDAAAFYEAACKITTFPAAQRLLFDLADWEKKHLKTFAAIRQELAGQEKEAGSFDPRCEIAQYLQALAEQAPFDDGEDPLAAFGSDPALNDILKVALGRERDAVAFYAGVKELVPNALGKDKVADVIREEMAHVTLLNSLLRQFKG